MKISTRIIFVLGFVWLIFDALVSKTMMSAAHVGYASDFYGQESFTQKEFRSIMNGHYLKLDRSIPNLIGPAVLLAIGWLGEIIVTKRSNNEPTGSGR
ncbi:MAG: hypothetical protein ACAH89_07660 [Rariglobus sp.]|nr:hypothetical protein [Rariglobus sp.]